MYIHETAQNLQGNETGASNSPGVSFIMYLFKKLLVAVYASRDVQVYLTKKKIAIYYIQLLWGVSLDKECVQYSFIIL